MPSPGAPHMPMPPAPNMGFGVSENSCLVRTYKLYIYNMLNIYEKYLDEGGADTGKCIY